MARRQPCGRRVGPIRFLHIPKAGSVIAPWIWAYACEGLTREGPLTLKGARRHSGETTTDLAWMRNASCPCIHLDHPGDEVALAMARMFHHEPIRSDSAAAAAIGLFREPVSLATSAFDYDRRTRKLARKMHNETLQALPPITAAPGARRRCAWPQHTLCTDLQLRLEWLYTFMRLPKFRHGSTKMLNGRMRDDASYNVTPPSLHTALRTVGRMRFVGLTECFNESAWLF